MNATPQDVTKNSRRNDSRARNRVSARNRSRQRERMLEWLRATDRHPTATQIHSTLLAEMPSLSLGTVYRNLDVLVADGEIDEVASGSGATRYDGNPEPHHHFHCEDCGRIIDIDVTVPRGLVKKLASEHGLVSSRVRMSFFGLCNECEERPKRGSPEREDFDGEAGR